MKILTEITEEEYRALSDEEREVVRLESLLASKLLEAVGVEDNGLETVRQGRIPIDPAETTILEFEENTSS